MRKTKERLPTTMEAGPAKMQSADWGKMKSAYMRMGEGADFTPTLKGLPEDLCQAPHWGYVLEGEIQVRYGDGHEESIEAGQLYYLPPGHTVWFDEPTEFVEFSPKEEMDDVLAHIEKQMQAA
jgi:mannose-6-phosphate isomerase-like protein (cupin superfamily)